MKALTIAKKKDLSGGSFYTVALGINLLVTTITSVATTIIEATQAANSNNKSSYQKGYASKRSKSYVRFSPMPSRSAISIWM